MLFAIEWIRNLYAQIAGFVQAFISSATLDTISGALSGAWFIFLPCAMAGLALCFYGFRLHKLVSGLLGAMMLGYIGYLVGLSTGGTFLTVPILYAMVLGIVGFFFLYMIYPIHVFLAGFLFINALFVGAFGLPLDKSMWIAFFLAFAFCLAYARFISVTSALAGAVVLGMLARPLLGNAGAGALCLAFAIGGALMQRAAKKRYAAKLKQEEEEQLVKYPYGPGIRDKQKAARQAERSAKGRQAEDASTKEQGVRA